MQDYIKLYDAETCDNTIHKIEQLNLWEDGRLTTTGVFKDLKRSVEMNGEARYTQKMQEDVKQVLINNYEVEKRCLIRSVNGVLINKYETGGHYGGHYDSPEINGANHHFSFTIFLNDNYKGG